MKKEQEKVLFEILKKRISDTFLQEFSTSNPSISHWKGIEIVYFQEHLLKKVRANVSEKWFYTYFKQDFEKLPRIDMLNLLAQYSGFQSWADFAEQHKQEIEHLNHEKIIENLTQELEGSKQQWESKSKSLTSFIKNRYLKWTFYSLLGILMVSVAYLVYVRNYQYEFFFYNSEEGRKIKENPLVTIYKGNAEIVEQDSGRIVLKSFDDTIDIIVNSNLYVSDTFKINLNSAKQQEKINLQPDNYTNQLYYYSKNNVNVDQKRKVLDRLIDENALIYQAFYNDEYGYEVMTKEQYIDYFSLNTTSLQKFVIIKSKVKNGKIVELKFKIKRDEK